MTQPYTIAGGIKIDSSNKLASTQKPVYRLPLPDTLWIPLRQNYGVPPKCIVKLGDRVLRYQTLAIPNDIISSPVHAPTSGIVEAITDHPIPHVSGLPDRCIVLKVDHLDESIDVEPIDWENAEPLVIRQWIRDAGVVGLGGAVFPADIKIHPPTEILVINGAECEPYISCDDMLMRTYADEIIQGTLVLQATCQSSKIIIGIEDDKPEAIRSMRAAIDRLPAPCDIQVKAIPARYPSGYAKQLIYLVTGINVPSDARSYDYGVQCFNVATTYSVYKAVIKGEPQISRLVTVTGDVESPRNYEVAIGTPMDYVLSFSKMKNSMASVVMGGPMMGFPVQSLSTPIVKASSCLLVLPDDFLANKREEIACIRCGACAAVCPVSLSPYLMQAYIKGDRLDRAEKTHLFDCIECGCCSYVCPSNIPLVQYFKYAKDAVYAQRSEKKASEKAKINFEKKQARLALIEKEKAEKLAKAKALAAEKAAQKVAESPETVSAEKAAIAEALERVRQKRAVKAEEEPS